MLRKDFCFLCLTNVPILLHTQLSRGLLSSKCRESFPSTCLRSELLGGKYAGKTILDLGPDFENKCFWRKTETEQEG